MKKRTAFIGHREVFYPDIINKRLQNEIEQIITGGCKHFIMGSHGEFDKMALSACLDARGTHPEIVIDVVLTSYHQIEKRVWGYNPYSEINTLMFDIEDEHFKRQITVSNQKMIDQCDTVICYVDEKAIRSGAKKAIKYAQKKGLKIINLFREEDDPTYGMTEEQKKEYYDKIRAELHLLAKQERM